jgi:hypothetical protein
MKRTINGVDLEIAPKANLHGADLYGANLCGANLRGANLCEANLHGANGNMKEIKSAMFDTWQINWIQSPEQITHLQIGCQRHGLEKWHNADPEWINIMAPNATEWWNKYGAIILALVDASPAVPYGKPTESPTQQNEVPA